MKRTAVYCDGCGDEIRINVNYLQVDLDGTERHFESVTCLAKFAKEQTSLVIFAEEAQIHNITLMKVER